MDGLNQFLVSEAGRVFCVVVLLLAVADLFIARVTFEKLCTQKLQSVKLGMPPAEKAVIEQKVKTLRTAQKLVYVGATFLGLLGIYGLTL